MKENTKKNTLATIAIIVILLLIIGGIILGATKNNEYTVVFDSKGGTVVTSQTVKAGETLKEPDAPEKVGYSFIGWYESDGSNVKYDFNSKVNKNFTLIAKWEVKQTDKEITQVSIISQKTEIVAGEKLKLEVKTVPEDAIVDIKKISWSSSDETVATVDKNGNVVALKAGKVTITVKIGDITNKIELTITEKVAENNNNNENNNVTNNNANSNTNKTSNNKNQNDNSNQNNSKPNNSNTNEPATPSEPVIPSEPEKPEEPQKPEVTYTYEWVKVETSVAGQYKLYIKSSEGKYVSGTATLTTIGGNSSSVAIPETGAVYVKDAIASVSNVKAN